MLSRIFLHFMMVAFLLSKMKIYKLSWLSVEEFRLLVHDICSQLQMFKILLILEKIFQVLLENGTCFVNIYKILGKIKKYLFLSLRYFVDRWKVVVFWGQFHHFIWYSFFYHRDISKGVVPKLGHLRWKFLDASVSMPFRIIGDYYIGWKCNSSKLDKLFATHRGMRTMIRFLC
jgi:hypothetical protein